MPRPARRRQKPFLKRTNRRLLLETLEDRSLMAGIVPPTGLISWWGGENSAMDLAGDNDGTPLQGATYATGRVGQAFSFDGVNDRVEIGDQASLKLTSSLTIEGWVRVDALPTAPKHGHILFRGDDRNGLDPYYLAVSSEGQFKFNIDSLTAKSRIDGGTVPLGQFVHVAATLDDATGSQRIYVNGVLAVEAITTVRPFGDLDPASNPGIAIGNHSGYPTSPHNYPLNGGIDELSVYDRALTPEELQSIYTAGLDGNGKVAISISDATATEGSSSYHFIDNFVAPDAHGLAASRQVVIGSNGNVYVVSKDTDAVKIFEGGTGRYIRDLVTPAGELSGPWSLTFGPDGGLYVAGGSQNIIRFDVTTGRGTVFVSTADNGGMQGVKGMTFGPDGNLYASSDDGGDPSGPARNSVLRFDGQTGAFQSIFVASGSGGLDNPNGLTFGPDGNLYVASTKTDSVLRYDGQTGAFLGTFVSPNSGGVDAPNYLTFRNDGLLYVASQFTNQLLRYNSSTGAFVDTFVNNTQIMGFAFSASGVLYLSAGTSAGLPGSSVDRYAPLQFAAFTVALTQPATTTVSINFATANGSAVAGLDYVATNGTLGFSAGETTRTVLVQTIDDLVYEGNESFIVHLSNAVGSVIADGQGVGTIIDNEPMPTKFYVVDDAFANKTFEYGASGAAVENYSINSGNTAPRGATSTATGDKVWTVDANKNVYVYNTSGGLLGSWEAGSLAANATVEGVTTNGTDVWVVDARQDKVFRYTGAASRTSGSQNAASSFSLNKGNINPKDIVTDGASLWVVDDSSTDKVFKYNASTGALLGSWTISTAGITPAPTSPTGITLDPSNPSHLWIVDSGTDRVYQYDAAVTRTSGSQTPSTSFSLAAGNANPQGIADPPVGDSSASVFDAASAGATTPVPVLAGYQVVSAEREGSTPATYGEGEHDALTQFLSEAGNPAVLLPCDGVVRPESGAAATRLFSSHDDALCEIADEMDSLDHGLRTLRGIASR